MKYIKSFLESRETSSGFLTNREEILKVLWQIKVDLDKVTIHPDGSVDVDGDVEIWNQDWEKLPIKFGKTGPFWINSTPLTTLDGCPHTCSGFWISNLKITTLEGGPKHVHGDYGFGQCLITSLIGAPEKVTGKFDCSYSPIKTLDGSPRLVGSFNCTSTHITDLKGGPEELTDYERGMEGGYFKAERCSYLTSLDGLPKSVAILSVSGSESLWDPRTLKDASVLHELECFDTKISELCHFFFNQFRGYEVRPGLEEFILSLDYFYIRPPSKRYYGEPGINLFRFTEALDELGLPPLKSNLRSIGKYIFLDDEGMRVYPSGKRFSR